MARNIAHGNVNAVQVGTVHGNVRMPTGGRVQVSGTTTDDDNTDVVNEVNGVQAGTIHGHITIGQA